MIRFVSLPLFLVFATTLGAEEPRPPTFLVRTADGKSHEGALRELGKDGSATLGATQPVTVPGAQLLSLRQAGRPLPTFPRQQHVILANGDRLPVTAPRLDGDKLVFRHADLGG